MDEILDIKKLEAIIEALLFAVGDRVSIESVSEVIELDKKTTKAIMNNMIYSYNRSARGVMIREVDNGYQMCSRQEYHEYVKKAFEPKVRSYLTQAALETLSIIAYNGPITKAKIEQIRGVNSEGAVSRLVERNLVKETGRLDAPGKPIIFDVTEDFYRSFGFGSKVDLPVLEMKDSVGELEMKASTETDETEKQSINLKECVEIPYDVESTDDVEIPDDIDIPKDLFIKTDVAFGIARSNKTDENLEVSDCKHISTSKESVGRESVDN